MSCLYAYEKFCTFVFLHRQITLWCSVLVCSQWIDIWVLLNKDKILTPAEQILKPQVSAYLTGCAYLYIMYSCSSHCRAYVCLAFLPLTTRTWWACSQLIIYPPVTVSLLRKIGSIKTLLLWKVFLKPVP